MSQQELQSQRVALGRLLQTAGGSETPAWTDVEAVDYDWSVPHHFIPAQLERLSAFAAAAAGKIAEALNSLLRSDMQLATGAIQEQYARDLRGGEEDEAAEYFTPLMTGSGEPYGTLALPVGAPGRLRRPGRRGQGALLAGKLPAARHFHRAGDRPVGGVRRRRRSDAPRWKGNHKGPNRRRRRWEPGVFPDHLPPAGLR